MAAKMIAARLMPEPQKTRKTFLGGERYMSKRDMKEVSLFNFHVFSSMLLSAKQGGTCPGYLQHTFEDRIQRQQ